MEIERAFDRTAHEAAETIDRTKAEIERSCGLIDGLAHPLASQPDGNEKRRGANVRRRG